MKNQDNLEFEINPIRLTYLLDLYKLSKENFLKLIQGSNKKSVIGIDDLNQILNKQKKVNLPLLKKIDTIFEKGITWYISNRDLPDRKNLSIFFRKDKFNAELNLGSIKKIEEFERKNTEIKILCDKIGYRAEKKFNFSLTDNPKKVSEIIKSQFNLKKESLIKRNILKKTNSDRDYLENLIRIFEEFNIFVFEFIDKKRKEELVSNFNGFFMKPNLIVLKRQQDYLKREIFTLLHEFAHYLIDEEEIDAQIGEILIEKQNNIEKWCNNFAYNFLIGEYDDLINNLDNATIKNSFHEEKLNEISNITHLSTLALYTRLVIINKISNSNYNEIKNKIYESIYKEKEKKKFELALEKEKAEANGEKIFISSPKPIESNLLKEIVRINYFEGNVSESKAMETLGLKNKPFEEVLYS